MATIILTAAAISLAQAIASRRNLDAGDIISEAWIRLAENKATDEKQAVRDAARDLFDKQTGRTHRTSEAAQYRIQPLTQAIIDDMSTTDDNATLELADARKNLDRAEAAYFDLMVRNPELATLTIRKRFETANELGIMPRELQVSEPRFYGIAAATLRKAEEALGQRKVTFASDRGKVQEAYRGQR